MKLLSFTIIKLTICLVVGILIGYFLGIELYLSIGIVSVFLALLLVLYFIAKKRFTKTIWFGLATYLSMISIGILTVNLHDETNFDHHYSHHVDLSKDSLHTISFRIREVLKPGFYHNKYVVDVLKLNDQEVTGKTLLNIEKDSTNSTLKVDDIFLVKTQFKSINPPLNPGQFDYRNYLKKKYIYHQIVVDEDFLLKADSKQITILGIANSIRDFINLKLKQYNFEPDELAIINALFLGQRQDISAEVYSNYIDAGAVHILAVSGLHVGIILLILSWLLKPLERLKRGKLFKASLLVFLLWCFAIIAGLSPSVTRAVTMFSVVAIGMNLNRPANTYNTLAISMFIILLFKPLFIFEVGFQLSYLAVFSIVTIDPILYRLWRPKNWILDLYWHTLTVTLAAQLGIIPVSLYYFHQFPGVFFVSNLVIIPLLGLILGCGILVIFLATINALPNLLASTFGQIIGWMNNFIGWVAQQDTFLFQDIPFSLLYVIMAYAIFIAFFKWVFRKNYANLRLFLVVVILAQCAFIYLNLSKPDNAFIVFHKSRNSLIGKVNEHKIKVDHDMDSLTWSKNNTITNYRVANQIKTVETDGLKDFYNLNNQKLLVVDSLGIYNLKSMQPDYVLLRQSPRINLNRLIDSIQPKQIIADGSNYKSYAERWKAICKMKKLPFHYTLEKGAYIINY
ncbi:ComEC/Rec2 family competence protein [Hyunsoonleella rubra]|uniref:ComEC/Rec2 family competence protein n=1 Tax=Hyunsoonleella rubra TaxID=1737062 RepID=A0ABW5TD16_9FLAO